MKHISLSNMSEFLKKIHRIVDKDCMVVIQTTRKGFKLHFLGYKNDLKGEFEDMGDDEGEGFGSIHNKKITKGFSNSKSKINQKQTYFG